MKNKSRNLEDKVKTFNNFQYEFQKKIMKRMQERKYSKRIP